MFSLIQAIFSAEKDIHKPILSRKQQIYWNVTSLLISNDRLLLTICTATLFDRSFNRFTHLVALTTTIMCITSTLISCIPISTLHSYIYCKTKTSQVCEMRRSPARGKFRGWSEGLKI